MDITKIVNKNTITLICVNIESKFDNTYSDLNSYIFFTKALEYLKEKRSLSECYSFEKIQGCLITDLQVLIEYEEDFTSSQERILKNIKGSDTQMIVYLKTHRNCKKPFLLQPLDEFAFWKKDLSDILYKFEYPLSDKINLDEEIERFWNQIDEKYKEKFSK